MPDGMSPSRAVISRLPAKRAEEIYLPKCGQILDN